MISEIKNIPLADFLSSLGHEPAATTGTDAIVQGRDRP